jgi:hypothetical protein
VKFALKTTWHPQELEDAGMSESKISAAHAHRKDTILVHVNTNKGINIIYIRIYGTRKSFKISSEMSAALIRNSFFFPEFSGVNMQTAENFLERDSFKPG